MKTLLCLVIVAVTASIGTEGRQVTFRATADAVLVDVSVTHNRVPVTNLTVQDFELLDDGVPQDLVDASLEETMPLNLSLVVDSSTSVAGAARNSILASVRAIGGLLTASDRLRLLSVDGDIRETTPDVFYQTVEAQERGHLADGGTPLYDAVTFAAMTNAAPGYRPVVLVLTDGVDTNSVLPETSSTAILERTDSTLYCVEVAEWPHLWVLEFAKNGGGVPVQLTYDLRNSAVFDDSGGRHVVVRPEDDFVAAVRDLLAGLRSRYLLRYIPRGVDRPGWHALRVRTKHGTYDMRARRGYQR
jgi:Ca-activated chloride channel family protein